MSEAFMPATSLAEASRNSVKTDGGTYAVRNTRSHFGTSSRKKLVGHGRLVVELPPGSGTSSGQTKADPGRRRHLFLSGKEPSQGGGSSESTVLQGGSSGWKSSALHSLSYHQRHNEISK